MTGAEQHALVSNAGNDPLRVWIEPWCDELTLPPKSWLSFHCRGAGDVEILPPDLEINDDTLVVWAGGPGTAIISIDGIEQDTGSKIIEVPPGLFDMPIKSFVNLAFGGFPEARPGGIRPIIQQTLLSRLIAKWRSFRAGG